MEERKMSALEMNLIEKAVKNAIEIAAEKGTIAEFVTALLYVRCPEPLVTHPVHMLGEALATLEVMKNNPRS